MRIHRIPGIKRVVITTNLDDFSSDNPPSPLKLDGQHAEIRFPEDGTPLHYSYPFCTGCLSRRVSRNGTLFRIQGHICRDCRYSFVARPPNYGYGRHYPDDVREKGVKTRVKTSLRKAADFFRIIGNAIISHVNHTEICSISPLKK